MMDPASRDRLLLMEWSAKWVWSEHQNWYWLTGQPLDPDLILAGQGNMVMSLIEVLDLIQAWWRCRGGRKGGGHSSNMAGRSAGRDQQTHSGEDWVCLVGRRHRL